MKFRIQLNFLSYSINISINSLVEVSFSFFGYLLEGLARVIGRWSGGICLSNKQTNPEFMEWGRERKFAKDLGRVSWRGEEKKPYGRRAGGHFLLCCERLHVRLWMLLFSSFKI